MRKELDIVVIGAGHAGLNAIKEIRKVTDNYMLVNGGELGTTCARFGCMPSKVAIQLAEVFHTRSRYGKYGIEGGSDLRVDSMEVLEHVRDQRDTFVDLILANTTDEMGDELIDGYAEFLGPRKLKIGQRVIEAKAVVVATGARSYVPPAWRAFEQDLITVENLFEQERLPESIAIVGMGPIGIEIGQALHRLGVSVTGIEQGTRIARIDDPVVNQVALDTLSREFPIWLGEQAVVRRANGGLLVQAGERSVQVEKVFVAMGRRPNLETLRIHRLGVPLNTLGVPSFDPTTMQVGDLPVFLAGDVTGSTATLQRAADEGRIAGYNAVRTYPVAFKPKTALSIIFTEPNVASVGFALEELRADEIEIGQIRFGPIGRAMIMGQNRGILRVYAEKDSGQILGAAMTGPRCEHLAHLLGWAVEKRMTVNDVLKMPFYHPVVEEVLQDLMHEMSRKIFGSGDSMNQFQRLRLNYSQSVRVS